MHKKQNIAKYVHHFIVFLSFQGTDGEVGLNESLKQSQIGICFYHFLWTDGQFWRDIIPPFPPIFVVDKHQGIASPPAATLTILQLWQFV